MRKIFGFVLCLSVALFSVATLSSFGDDDNDGNGKSGSGKKQFTHEMVDLGLPSGLLWATCNVGASSPYEDGDYFAWGETNPKSDYTWKTYKWCKRSYRKLTKYCNDSSCGYNCFTDYTTVLDAEDDAATANSGAGYRMPTCDEFDELCANCTWTWDSTHNGYTATGTNGNSIFLPASGYRYGSSLGSHGSYGGFWSATLYSGNAYIAYDLSFFSGGHNPYSYVDRCDGQSVRPVAEPKDACNVHH